VQGLAGVAGGLRGEASRRDAWLPQATLTEKYSPYPDNPEERLFTIRLYML
jgi:hypothetical protein